MVAIAAAIVALAAGLAVGFMAGALFRATATPCGNCARGETSLRNEIVEDVLVREALGQ